MRAFADLQARVLALRAAGEHAAAEALAAAEEHRHPAEWDRIAWWRICAAARTGRADDALVLLASVVDRGGWYPPERFLEEEKDFESLAGDARFAALVETCRTRRDRAAARSRPSLTLVAPATPPPWPALVALHGNGETASAAVDAWGSVAASGRLLAAPQSGTPLGASRFAWSAATTGEITRHVRALRDLGAIRDDDLILGGFDRGAFHALRLALTGPPSARGAIMVAPAMNTIDELAGSLPAASARGLRVAIVAGSADARAARAVPRVAAALRDAGIEVLVDLRDGLAHDYPDDFEETLPRLFGFVAPA